MLNKKTVAVSLLAMTFATPTWAGFYVAPGLNYDAFKLGSLNYEGLSPRFAGGYSAWVRQWLYLGLEGYINYPYRKVNASSGPGALTVDYTYGISAIPGFILDEEMVGYVRVGWAGVEFQQNSISKSGWQVGLGLQATLTDCWDIRGEYAYARYDSVSAGKLRADEFVVSLVYRFNPYGLFSSFT